MSLPPEVWMRGCHFLCPSYHSQRKMGLYYLGSPFLHPLCVCLFFFFFSSTSLLLPTHLPLPSCMCTQSCNPMDYSLSGSSVHGLFQARMLGWVAVSFSFKEIFSFETISIWLSASNWLHHHYLPFNPSYHHLPSFPIYHCYLPSITENHGTGLTIISLSCCVLPSPWVSSKSMWIRYLSLWPPGALIS